MQVDLRATAIHGAQDSLGGLESQYVFNYPIVNATASWNATLPGGFIARSRVGVIKRFERQAYGLVGHLSREPAHAISRELVAVRAVDQSDLDAVSGDPRGRDAGPRDPGRNRLAHAVLIGFR